MCATYWGYSISYGPPDNPKRSGLCGTASSLPKAIQLATADCMYYLGMGYEVRLDGYYEICQQCNGSGTKQRPRLKQVKCCACKGKGQLQSIHVEERIVVPNNVSVVTT